MARSHEKRKESKKQEKKPVFQYVVIISVILIAAALLLVKQAQKKNTPLLSEGDILPIAEQAIPVIPTATAITETLEEKIDRLHQEKQPIFAFFHSDDCYLCTEMMKVVDEVYPDYEGKINLVDINVYDEANRNLLVRAQIRAIPTQLFFDSNGEVTVTAGLMSAEQLRAALDLLSGE